jgi:hypothetical protein
VKKLKALNKDLIISNELVFGALGINKSSSLVEIHNLAMNEGGLDLSH